MDRSWELVASNYYDADARIEFMDFWWAIAVRIEDFI